MGPSRCNLDGGRLHFQHGPIDLIIGADGQADAVAAALEDAWTRFQQVLPELVQELRVLRQPMTGAEPSVQGAVARRMVAAVVKFPGVFITPMAAVAGAVADELIAYFHREGVTRAYVNNGGDIALHVTAGQGLRIGLAADAAGKHWKRVALQGTLELTSAVSSRGVATSGWRGRSFSLGIADSVTVLARSAALADAAATLVANAVDVDSAAVTRRPANRLKDDTDLGDRLVTVAVGTLRDTDVLAALENGLRVAEVMMRGGGIAGATLELAGVRRHTGYLGVAYESSDENMCMGGAAAQI